MSNSTNDFTIDLMNNISSQFNRYTILFIFLFGSVGNLLNILVLVQPVFYSNPCALYFLGSSIFGLGIILFGLPLRFIGAWISTDPTNTISWLCKSRIFLLYSCRTTYVWLLVFATLDRWLSSSREIHRRRLSSCIAARKSIIIISFLSCALWTESLYCYDSNVLHAPLKCYGKTNACRIFNDIVYASSTVAIPSLLMLVFGLLTIRNITRSHRAVQPLVNTLTKIKPLDRTKQRRNRRSEGSLTRMLLFQVTLLTLCSMPQAIHQFYFTFTIDDNRGLLRTAIENFIVNFDLLLTYIGNGISFYIYTLYGTVFRQTLIRTIRSIVRQCKFSERH